MFSRGLTIYNEKIVNFDKSNGSEAILNKHDKVIFIIYIDIYKYRERDRKI